MDSLSDPSDQFSRHIQYGCRERNALYVNESQGPTFYLKGDGPPAQTSSMYSQALIVHDHALRYFEAGSSQPKPASSQPKPAEPAPTKSNKLKLTPYSGRIMASDGEFEYKLDWRHIELEIDWPVTGNFCTVSGTARVDSWRQW